MPKLLVVIVNYRTPDLAIGTLRSLVAEVAGSPGTSVVVTDNDSQDGSSEKIAAAIEAQGWSSWVTPMPLDRNGGFAFGNNAAIKPALANPDGAPDYVLLLNPDTIVRPGALSALLEFMEQHHDVGIAGSRLEEPDGTQHDSRYRFPGVLSELEAGVRLGFVSKLLAAHCISPPLVLEDHRIDWVAGASMIVRRAVFEDIGLMDEQYFLYFEEVDFCLRAHRAGWKCWYVPKSRVVHLVGQSSGLTNVNQVARRRPAYWFESRRRYFVKNHGRAYAFATDVAWTLGFGLWRLRAKLQHKPDNDPPHLLGDFVRFNFFGVRST